MVVNTSDTSSRASVSYIETYPFPAFILTTQHAHAGPSQSRIGWKNNKWDQWSGGETLEELMQSETLEQFEQWVSADEEDTVFPLKARQKHLNLIKTIVPREDDLNSLCVITSLPSDFKIASIHPVAPDAPALIQSTPLFDPEAQHEPTYLSLDNNGSSEVLPPSLGCKSLLERTDWSKTRLGPREKWSSVIEMMIEVVLRSPTQDALWLGDDFQMIYLFNPTRDTTASVLARRRQETMRDLSEQLLTARTTNEFYNGIVEVLEQNPKDVPFLMCYSVEDGSEPNHVSLHLESSIGIPEGHHAAPMDLDLPLSADRFSRASFGMKGNQLSSPTLSAISALSSGAGRMRYSYDKQSWPIAQAISTRQAVVVDDCTDLIKGFPLREWEALPESAIIVPISSESSVETPQAVVIIGLNIASPLDSVYEDWIHVLRAHLTTSLGTVRAAEAEINRQIERDRMERAKTAWFQGAAHDLRSPLTLVAGPLDDVLRTTLSSGQRTALSLAQRNLARVQRLVNALLDFSRIEAGKLTGRFMPLDLGTFVKDLAMMFKPAVERRKIDYKIQIEPHEGMVFVDPTLLETVVTNLISNALKYTEKGVITIDLKYYLTHADIAIIDTGIGIPAAELSAVTDRFHRATTALSRGTEGTGIGLALSKEIVRLHGGDLFITSQTAEESGGPHGSTFTARIPLIERQVVQDSLARTDFGAYGKAVVDEAMHWISPSDADLESIGSENNESTSTRAEGYLFDRNDVLLLVDDNPDMRHYVKNIFSPYCRVIEAVNGKQALELAQKTPPHLILSDLMMPIMNGQELLTAIRSDPQTRMIPMVLLSAATDDELRLAAFVEGAEDFMLKPFKPKELLARVHLHMQIGKKRAHLEMLYAQRQQEIDVILDYCPSGIVRADATGKIIYGNDTYRAYTGIPHDVDLNNWAEYVDDSIRDDLEFKWNQVVHGDERETTETWKWSNGTSVSGTFIRLDKIDSSLSGVLGCLSDVSYQEEKLLEAERRRIEAEESKQQQELLVDLTSHEIRTPVSAILQCSSLVKENLTALQDQLRAVGPNGFKATPELLAEIDEDLEALDNRAGIASIKTDHVRLHQVATNLISNAIRFTASSKTRIITVKYEIAFAPPADDTCAPSSTEETAITLPVEEDTKVWLFVAIKDTGPGLGPTEQAGLFQRFSRE
ncbi:uncharacterized protein L199_002232 [Kwoniella botswanensis]|uniref:uncharacterized protein n=1 Tax=Kwoniella botswanensis TaxID=1268659 RepID=UPI00315CC590